MFGVQVLCWALQPTVPALIRAEGHQAGGKVRGYPPSHTAWTTTRFLRSKMHSLSFSVKFDAECRHMISSVHRWHKATLLKAPQGASPPSTSETNWGAHRFGHRSQIFQGRSRRRPSARKHQNSSGQDCPYVVVALSQGLRDLVSQELPLHRPLVAVDVCFLMFS